MKFRIEKDSMGSVKVPANRYWGAQTQRSLENFSTGEKMPLEIIRAMTIIKKSCAYANYKLNTLSKEKLILIEKVCQEILSGEMQEEFPLVVWQTGSGTQTNMNINEVISNRAHVLQGGQLSDIKKILHPNDDLNKSQSSNDTFPSAMNIAAMISIQENLLPSIKLLRDALSDKSIEFKDIVKTGRTHLMDATPISFGQEFSGYVAQLDYSMKAIKNSLSHLSELAIGGTAVGTGLNAPKGFDKLVCEQLSQYTGFRFIPAANKFEAIASNDALVETHGAIKQLAVSLTKIGNDLRFMSSGPRCGLSEIFIPENEPGSSILPGKVNPTQIEALTMACVQVIGNDSIISMGGMNGHFELNAYKPLIIYNFLQSVKLLSGICKSFTERCVKGIEINLNQSEIYLNKSLMLVTALSKSIGYEKSAIIAQKAYDNNISLRKAALETGFVSEEEFDQIVVPKNMI